MKTINLHECGDEFTIISQLSDISSEFECMKAINASNNEKFETSIIIGMNVILFAFINAWIFASN